MVWPHSSIPEGKGAEVSKEERANELLKIVYSTDAYDKTEVLKAIATFLSTIERETLLDIDARIGLGGHRIEYMRSSTWELEYRELAAYVTKRLGPLAEPQHATPSQEPTR